MGALAIIPTDKAIVAPESAALAVVPPPAHPLQQRHTMPVAAVSQELPVKVRAKAQERLEFCRAIIAMKERTGRSMEECCNIVAIREASRFPELLKGGQGGKSQLTLANCHNWLRKLGRRYNGEYNWDNHAALMDGYARGTQVLNSENPFWELFDTVFLNRNQLSISESYRFAAAQARKDNPLAKIPNEHQARYRVSKLDVAVVYLARCGEEATKNKFLDFIRRDWLQVIPGEMYFSDHRMFDAWIRVWDDDKKQWKATRPYITAMMDARSWFVPGWVISDRTPDCQSIIDALGMAIINNDMRPPCYLYTDRGSDFLKEGFNRPVTIDGHEHCLLRELGIQDITAIAYNARAKTVERFFKDTATTFDKWLPCYLGNTPSARPDAANFYSKHPEELLSLEQFTELFNTWLEQYMLITKDGSIHGGKSPAEIWNSRPELRPAWHQTKLKYAMLMPVASTRTVHRGPAISYDNVEYFSAGLWPYLDKQVMVKYSSHDPDTVYAYTSDGKIITSAHTRAKVNALAKTDEERQAISEGMRSQRSQLRYCYTMLNNLTNKKHLVSPSQWMLAEGNDDADLEIVKAGECSSVKGANHNFAHYNLVSKNPTATPKNDDGNMDLTDYQLEKKLDFNRKLAETLLQKQPDATEKLMLAEPILTNNIKEKFVLKD